VSRPRSAARPSYTTREPSLIEIRSVSQIRAPPAPAVSPSDVTSSASLVSDAPGLPIVTDPLDCAPGRRPDPERIAAPSREFDSDTAPLAPISLNAARLSVVPKIKTPTTAIAARKLNT
jgi:hypothetical protein